MFSINRSNNDDFFFPAVVSVTGGFTAVDSKHSKQL